MKESDIIVAIRPVVKAFEKLGIPYYIGGSVASSAYGMARATLDVDMIADMKPRHIHSLVELLESSYYIDEDMIAEAIRRYSSFNIIHLETTVKVDVFVVKNQPYHRESLRRRKEDVLDESQENTTFYLVSPEDIVLSKLERYRRGGKVSERQWNDVLGVLKVQENSLDMAYLRRWASELELTDLLKQVCADAGIELD